MHRTNIPPKHLTMKMTKQSSLCAIFRGALMNPSTSNHPAKCSVAIPPCGIWLCYILCCADDTLYTGLSLIHISEPTRLGMISYAVFCLKKKKKYNTNNQHHRNTKRQEAHTKPKKNDT